MALSASTVWEIRGDGSDNNGGSFVSGGAGTDRSQQAAAHATLTTSSTVHTTTTQINVAVGDYTVTSADADNTFQLTSGTATAGFYRITAVDVPNNRWTMDRSVGTAGQTTAGAMGGALLSPGKTAGAVVAGNTVWWKKGSTTYDVTTTTANVSGGRVLPAVASLRWEGYSATRGDLQSATTTADYPTIKATVNTMTLFSSASATGLFSFFIADAGTATGITPVATGAGTTTHRVKTIGGNATASFNCGSGSFLSLCGASGGSVPGFRMNGSTLHGCVARGMSTFGFESAASHNTCVDCVVDSVTGNAPGFTNTGAASRLFCINCDSFGNTATTSAHGFANPGVAHSLAQTNCVADSNSGTGIGANNASHAFNCASRSNDVNFGANTVQYNTVALSSGSPFTSAAGHDFSLNSTAGAGAALQGAGIPGAFPDVISTTGSIDVGAAQKAGSSASDVVNSRRFLLVLPRAWDIEN